MPVGQLTISVVHLSRSQTNDVLFGLGMRLHVCMRTKLENGVLCNGQQLGSAVNSFVNQGEFEAIKTLSGRRALRCDKHQFHAQLDWTDYIGKKHTFILEEQNNLEEHGIAQHLLGGGYNKHTVNN